MSLSTSPLCLPSFIDPKQIRVIEVFLEVFTNLLYGFPLAKHYLNTLYNHDVTHDYFVIRGESPMSLQLEQNLHPSFLYVFHKNTVLQVFGHVQ